MSKTSERRAAVSFTDNSLRHAVMTAARDVYKAMGAADDAEGVRRFVAG